MFPPILRWAVIVASIVFAILSWNTSRISSIVFAAGALLLVIGYFQNGTVFLAYRAFRAGRLEDMERLLMRTRSPDLLAPKQRVMYEYLSGMAADRRGDLVAARRHFFFATVERRYNRLRAQAWVQLAHTELLMGDIGGARASIAQARRIAQPGLELHVQQVERAIEQAERA